MVKADSSRYAVFNDVRVFNLGLVALFINYRLTTSSRKHLEGFCHAHIVSLLHKPKTSAKVSDDLSIGFDRDCGRQQELTNNKNVTVKFHVRIMLKDIFGFAQCQEKPLAD